MKMIRYFILAGAIYVFYHSTFKPMYLEIKDKLIKLNNKYNNNRLLYEKKRNILKEEKEDIQADIVFYNSRIRNHKDI